MDTNNGFTVDLSAITFNNNSTTISIVPTAHAERKARVKARVDELIKPGKQYRVVDIEGDLLGHIGAETDVFNIDNDLNPEETDITYASSVEQLDEFLEMLDAMEEVIRRIDHPNTEKQGWSMQTTIESQQAWIQEQRDQEAEVRRDIAEDNAEVAAAATSCNGTLDRSIGDIVHTPGVWCPIHLMN